MSYECALHLVDVRIKSASVSAVSGVLGPQAERLPPRLRPFLARAAMDSDNFLVFTIDENDETAYVPDDQGHVPALSGKWKSSEDFARWLAQHSEKGGRLVLHSLEGDGAAWGWEFDGRGRMRTLGLTNVGRWE